MFLLFLFSILFQLSYSQKVIPLNSFLGNNNDNRIDVTPPYSLYVSAHSDSTDILRQIYVKTMNNQIMSLDQLKHNKASNKSGLLTPMRIQSQAFVSTMLNDQQMGALDGFLYITTEKQGNSDNFKVFDVDQSQAIQTSSLICDPCTLVFLNTNSQMTPVQSSVISKWQQDPSGVVKMYRGFPSDNDELQNTQIFSNPIKTAGLGMVLAPTVEKFSVSLGSFYLKTTSDLYFVIEPDYFDLDGYSTSGYHSTGFYMKSRIQNLKNVTVLCVRDTRFNGTTGSNVIGSLPNPAGRVTVSENDVTSNSDSTIPASQINGWSTKWIGQNLTISSKYSEGGEYFVQYFVIQDQQISFSTTPSVETTTRGGSVVDCMVGTMVMVMVSWILWIL
ncbi:unnamed protein product [Caenorhabditis brenneri]